MANDTEVKATIKTLWGAGLRNTPDTQRIPDIVAAWKKAMVDISGELLQRAAEDYILSEPFWPSIAEFRKFTWAMKSRNEQPKESRFTVRQDDKHSLKFHPFEYWAMVEAETYGLDQNEVLAQWKELNVKTFGDIDKWREAVVGVECTA